MQQYLVGDIGGTNARFAMVDEGEVLQDIEVMACADYPHIRDALQAYVDQVDCSKLAGICLAIACPVEGDRIDLLNSHWSFSRAKLEKAFAVPLKVVNDFTAQALCIDLLGESDMQWLGAQRPEQGGIRVVIGPGTGLGIATLMPSGEIVPSEGGHVGFSPTTGHQVDLLKVLWERFGRVSIERLISGQGLENLYWANAKLQGREKRLIAKDIAALAHSGDELALRAINDMFDVFASAAGDMALAFWATDGVYLTGGVLQKLVDYLDVDRFRRFFEDKGRFKEFCRSLPIATINTDQPGLLGCYAALKIDN